MYRTAFQMLEYINLLSLLGKYPVEAVQIMNKICLEAEAAMFHRVMYNELRDLTPTPTPTTTTTSIAAVDASFSQNCAAIICLTTTGRWATNRILLLSSSIEFPSSFNTCCLLVGYSWCFLFL